MLQILRSIFLLVSKNVVANVNFFLFDPNDIDVTHIILHNNRKVTELKSN